VCSTCASRGNTPGGHIAGAQLVPQAELALHLAALPADQDLLVVCRSGARSLRSARFLKAVGVTRVANLSGGMLAWARARHPIADDED
jgi:rhodanese-related sulfurtransferase